MRSFYNPNNTHNYNIMQKYQNLYITAAVWKCLERRNNITWNNLSPKKVDGVEIIITYAVSQNCKLIVILFKTRWLFMQHSFIFANTVSQSSIDVMIWTGIWMLMYLKIIGLFSAIMIEIVLFIIFSLLIFVYPIHSM